MLQGKAAKASALAAVAFLVAVVPGAVRFSPRDSAQRVETESNRPDDDPAGSEGEAPLDAVPSVADTDLPVDQAAGAERPAQLLDLSSGTGADPTDPDANTASDGAGAGDGDEAAAEGEGEQADAADGDSEKGATSTTVGATTSTTAPATNTTARSTTVGTAPGTDLRALYVDPSRGSGGNPGTEARPFRRPVDALSIAEPGTTIYLRGGTYDTSIHSGFSIRRSGTPDRWIRITSYPGERVELVAGGEYGSGFEVLGASYIEVSGLVLRGRNDSIHGVGVFVKDGAHDVRVVGNQISNFGGAGVSVIGSSRVTIEGNTIHDNAMRSHYQGSAITLFKMAGPTNSGHTNVVRGNYIFNNRTEVPHRNDGRITDGNCIIMDRNDESGYRGWTLIENNVCAENGGRGVHSFRSSYIEARNNTLYHNMTTSAIDSGRGELTAGHGRDIYFYNNLVINRPGVAAYIDTNNTNSRFEHNHVSSGPPPGPGNQVLPSGVSLFSSTSRGGPATQFRPLGGAGLAGTADGSKQASKDFSGRGRPGTGAVGAFEP